MMTMMPSIDLDKNEVTLAVRPTLSTIVDYVDDPATAIEAAQAGLPNLQNQIPEVQVRELDSTLKLKSGQTDGHWRADEADRHQHRQRRTVASGIPLLGNLFKGVSKKQYQPGTGAVD